MKLISALVIVLSLSTLASGQTQQESAQAKQECATAIITFNTTVSGTEGQINYAEWVMVGHMIEGFNCSYWVGRLAAQRLALEIWVQVFDDAVNKPSDDATMPINPATGVRYTLLEYATHLHETGQYAQSTPLFRLIRNFANSQKVRVDELSAEVQVIRLEELEAYWNWQMGQGQ